MGVHATWCQLCGLPAQHDHYVPAGGGMLRIYRGSSPGGGHDWSQGSEQPFPFGPQHAWLRDAVAVRFDGEGVVRGEVEDGGLAESPGGPEVLFVADGAEEDALVFHRACWTRLGSPTSTEAAARGNEGWELVAPYQEQLFDFARFAADGHGALLLDPDGPEGAASRARLEALLVAAGFTS